MSKREQKSILIEKFLKEELSETELAQFRDLWDTDPKFKKEVQDYSRLKVALKAADRMEKHNIGKRVFSHLKTAFFKYQSVAAVMLLAVMLPLYLLLQGQKRAITPESPEVSVLANSNFVKPDFRMAEVSQLKDAQSAYLNGEISRSIELIRQLQKESGVSRTFLMADLFFEANQMDSALHYYQSGLIINPQDEEAKWNSLMTGLLVGDFIKTKEELRAWSLRTDAVYAEKAGQLIFELE